MKRKSENFAGESRVRPWDIAVIGVRGAGKTTLAAGLFASSSKSFTIGAGDDTTRAYLERAKSELQDGKWPRMTQAEDRTDIMLTVNEGKGRVTPISFKDYMGELVSADSNFVETYVGNPDGAILLFNPGMDVLSNTQERNNMVSLYRKIIDHLKANGCRHIVFAVAAADRLEGDLGNEAAKLKGYEEEITNYLETAGGPGWWKRIEVTVTGRLEDQERPVLATGENNTAKEPFRYLLGRFNREKSARRLRSVIRRTAVCLAATAVALAAYVWFRFSDEKKWLDGSIGAARSFTPRSPEPLAKAKELVDDIERRISALRSRRPRFPTNRDRWLETLDGWTGRHETLVRDFLVCGIADLSSRASKDGTPSNISRMDHDIAGFNPVKNPRLREELMEKWSREKAKIREMHDDGLAETFRSRLTEAKNMSDCMNLVRHVTAWRPLSRNESVKEALLRDADLKCASKAELEWRVFDICAVTNASATSVAGFVRKIRDWTPAVPKAVSTRSNLVARLPDATAVWRARHEVRRLDACRARENLSAGSLAGVFKDTFSLQTAPDCPEETRDKAVSDVAKARAGLLDACAQSYAAAVWKPDDDFRNPGEWPGVSVEAWDPGGTAAKWLTGQERARFLETLSSKRRSAEKEWFVRQEKLAEEFVEKMKTVPAVAACMEYGAFCSDHPKSPALAGSVTRAFMENAEKALDAYLAHYRKDFLGENSLYASGDGIGERVKDAESRFADFKSLVLLFVSNSSAETKKTPFYRFAREAGPELSKGMNAAFKRAVTVKKVEVSFYDTKINTHHSGFNLTIAPHIASGTDDTRCPDLLTDRNFDDENIDGRWVVCFEGRSSFDLGDWQCAYLTVDITDRLMFGKNGKGSVRFPVNRDSGGGIIEREKGFSFDHLGGVNSTVLKMKIHAERGGSGFLDLVEKYFPGRRVQK